MQSGHKEKNPRVTRMIRSVMKKTTFQWLLSEETDLVYTLNQTLNLIKTIISLCRSLLPKLPVTWHYNLLDLVLVSESCRKVKITLKSWTYRYTFSDVLGPIDITFIEDTDNSDIFFIYILNHLINDTVQLKLNRCVKIIRKNVHCK